MASKKAQGLSPEMMVVIALCLLVLIVIAIIFSVRSGVFARSLRSCGSVGGECKSGTDIVNGECVLGQTVQSTDCDDGGKVDSKKCCVTAESIGAKAA
ncbi:MAG TPA: hypothetical protein VJI75_00835 [Candidatus Nanoarchaeia archaeon]|nr:hypothetical protein [Candidatus Nanoarchaeia archaeon]